MEAVNLLISDTVNAQHRKERKQKQTETPAMHITIKLMENACLGIKKKKQNKRQQQKLNKKSEKNKAS